MLSGLEGTWAQASAAVSSPRDLGSGVAHGDVQSDGDQVGKGERHDASASGWTITQD
ncbi:MAG: hypothetical protein ACTIA6_02870 [Pseudoclavibacter sp.]